MSTVLEKPPVAKPAARRFVLKGVMQAPVTPLHDDFSVDYDGLAKMVDFHVRNGAPAIAWPHHKAESPNLTIEERKRGAEVLIQTVAKRVPVSIFAAALSEEDALDIARHAQRAGADMLLTISPYCRRPTQEEIFHSIVRIGTHTDLPVLTYNSPWRNGEGVEFTSDLVSRLTADIPDQEFEAREFLGDKLEVVIGTGPKAVYLCAGKNAQTLLKTVIDASASAGEKDASPFQMEVAALPILKFFAAVDDRPMLPALIESLERGGNDRVTVTSQSLPRGSTIRIEVQEGLLKLIGEAVKQLGGDLNVL